MNIKKLDKSHAAIKLLGCIKEYIRKEGYPPNVREMVKQMHDKHNYGNSTSYIIYLLEKLERENYIKRNRFAARAIKVLK